MILINVTGKSADEGRFIELGAQFVHGEEDNAVYAIAAEKGLMDYVPQGHEDEIIIRTDQGTLVDNKLGTTIMSTVEEALKNAYAVDDARYATVQDYLNSKLLEFQASNPTLNKQMTESLWRSVEATMRIDHGCDSFKQMSLASTFEFRRSSGNYLGRLKRGYISIVESLANDIPKESIRLLQKVTRIDTNSKQGVRVVTEDGIVYHADHVIVTVSLGVLKANAQDLFIPRLPKKKLEAFQVWSVFQKYITWFQCMKMLSLLYRLLGLAQSTKCSYSLRVLSGKMVGNI